MKKILAIICCFLFAAVSYADNEVRLKSGNLAVFLQQEKTELEIDYSKAKVNGNTLDGYLKSRGEDFVRDWPDDAKKAREYFIVRFNKKNKKGLQITREGEAKYKIVFQISSLDMGNGGSTFIPFASAKAGGVIVSGILEVVNTATDQAVCCLDVDEVKGLGHMSETVRLGLCYFEVASKIFKLAKDADASAELTESPRETGDGSAKKVKVEVAPTVAAATPVSATPTKTSTVAKGKTTTVKSKPTTNTKKSATTKPVVQKTVAKTEEPTAKEVTTAVPKVSSVIGGSNAEVVQSLSGLRAHDYTNKRKRYFGDFQKLARENRIGAYVDFSNCDINGRMEDDFVKYMTTSAARRDQDTEFPTKWENEIKPSLASLITTGANKELKDEKIRLRFSSTLDTPYILKIAVSSCDEDGNNVIDYLFIDAASKEIVAQLQCEADGGHVGRYVGLLQQGFETAGEEFGKQLSDLMDD